MELDIPNLSLSAPCPDYRLPTTLATIGLGLLPSSLVPQVLRVTPLARHTPTGPVGMGGVGGLPPGLLLLEVAPGPGARVCGQSSPFLTLAGTGSSHSFCLSGH